MFYIRFTVLALTTAQLEIWWLLNTEFSQYITVIEAPVLNNSTLKHWQYNSNKPWSCLTCYNPGKDYSPGGRQAGGFTGDRFLISGWLFIVALLQHIIAFYCHFSLSFFFQKAMPWGPFGGLISGHEYCECGFFVCVVTLKYTYCSQWKTTTKSCSAQGEGLMGGRNSVPHLLVQNLTWRWWQKPKTLLVPTNSDGKQRLVRASQGFFCFERILMGISYFM